METTKQAVATTQSLLAQFNNAESKKDYKGNIFYPDRRSLAYELRTLLEQESNNWLRNYWGYARLDNEQIEEAKNLIALYKEVFDWDTTYSVGVKYSLIPSTMWHSISVEGKEDLQQYLNGDKEVEYPDTDSECFQNIDYEQEIDREEMVRAEISIKNLRLKEKVNQYSIVLTLNSKRDREYIQNNVLPNFAVEQEEGKEYWITGTLVSNNN